MPLWIIPSSASFQPFFDDGDSHYGVVFNLDVSASGGIDTTPIDNFREGVGLRRMADVLKSNQPKTRVGGSGQGFPVHANSTLRHDLELYGSINQGVGFVEATGNTAFNDQIKGVDGSTPSGSVRSSRIVDYMHDSTEVIAGRLTETAVYPIYMNNGPGMTEVSVIEPLPLTNRTPFVENPAANRRGANGAYEQGEVEFDHGTPVISRFKQFDPNTVRYRPFLEYGASFILVTSSNNGSVIGVVEQAPSDIPDPFQYARQVPWFDETRGKFQPRTISTGALALLSVSVTPVSHSSPLPYYALGYDMADSELQRRDGRAAPAGWSFPGSSEVARYGTDSIAYGGLKQEQTNASRLRGLTPWVRNKHKSHATGSYPTIWRTASDNRTGKSQLSLFRDRRSTKFGIQTTDVIYPLAMTAEAISASLDGPTIAACGQGIQTTGSMNHVTVEGLLDLSYDTNQRLLPFHDMQNPESSVGKANNVEFFATGSLPQNAGEGFAQPLWSKTKLVIDLSPAAVHSMSLVKSSSVANRSYPMAYWNPVRKQYDGIGSGNGIDSYDGTLSGLQSFLGEQTFGFAASMDNGSLPSGFSAGVFNLYGREFSDAGFPFHPKFMPTSSQLIDVGSLISEPFLLEKVVLEISGGLSLGPNFGLSNTAVWTFFLLNVRPCISGALSPAQTVSYTTAAASDYSTFTSATNLGNSILDVVDYMQVAVSAASDTRGYLQRESAPIAPWSGIDTGATRSIQLALSSSVKVQIPYSGSIASVFSGSAVDSKWFMPHLAYAGRNGGVQRSNGRDWINSNENPLVAGTASYSLGVGPGISVSINSQYSKTNAYLLMPTDRLVFGLQLPWDIDNLNITNSFEFAMTGINKLILYGSTMRFNEDTGQLEESHDGTLNQLLTSESIHEVF